MHACMYVCMYVCMHVWIMRSFINTLLTLLHRRSLACDAFIRQHSAHTCWRLRIQQQGLYVPMQACMHACMYVWIMHLFINTLLTLVGAFAYNNKVCMYLCRHVCMHACMYACMHLRPHILIMCIYVILYTFIHIR